MRVIELTMRTACALDALKIMQEEAPELIIGMGTIRTPHDIDRSISAGAAFLVSPGSTSTLLKSLVRSRAPSLPGVATAGEAMDAAEAGFSALKFFPAEPAGGVDYLKSLAGPLPDIVFCPTGGISAARAADYLALSNVACVGGSWVAPRGQIAAGEWETIEQNARRAAALAKA